MTYVEQSLSEGERLVLQAKVHWAIYLPAMVWFGIGCLLALMMIGGGAPLSAPIFWCFAGTCIAIVLALKASYYRASHEMGITNRKVVTKQGIISRKTMEQRLARIDSVTINQGLSGRLFGYGSVAIRGSGESFTPMRFVANPMEFKKLIDKAIHYYEAQAARAA